jgi:hypothetical protein
LVGQDDLQDAGGFGLADGGPASVSDARLLDEEAAANAAVKIAES